MESASLDQYFAAATGKTVGRARGTDADSSEDGAETTDQAAVTVARTGGSPADEFVQPLTQADSLPPIRPPGVEQDDAAAAEVLPTPGEADSTKEQREANRLVRVAEARAAKQRFAEMNRPVLKPPVPQMASTIEKPAQSEQPAAAPPTVHGDPPLRLRLDARHDSTNEHSSDNEGEGAPAPSKRFRLLNLITAPYQNFYRRCPNCRSEEVYAVEKTGRFLNRESERSLVMQTLYCERCITVFTRPGLLFGAPAPVLRPDDDELYD